MWPTILLAVGVFLLTVAETVVSTLEGSADRRRRSVVAANWATVFEVLLLVDVLALVHDPLKMFFPIVAGAWLGKYWAVEKRRKKFRSRRQKKISTPNS
jgi:hypothetical protein